MREVAEWVSQVVMAESASNHVVVDHVGHHAAIENAKMDTEPEGDAVDPCVGCECLRSACSEKYCYRAGGPIGFSGLTNFLSCKPSEDPERPYVKLGIYESKMDTSFCFTGV